MWPYIARDDGTGVGVSDSISNDVAAVGRIDVVDKILEVVCRTTGMGFAAIARVTQDRWVACAVRDEIAFGLGVGGELPVKTTICDEIRDSHKAVIIDHVAEDPGFHDHATPALYGLQSYISMPIIRRGEFFGTLCAIDPAPHTVNTPEIVGMFELFADLIAQHLDAEARVAETEAALVDERHVGELRDQFIAVLGHDLRNPLASIGGGARILLRMDLDEKARTMIGLMQGSVHRMTGLIDNVLDFARGRMGGGFDIEPAVEADMAGVLNQVVAEMRTAFPHRAIETDFALTAPVACDSRRVAQLFSNLLANANSHGAEDGPIRVHAVTGNGEFRLAVANTGETIPPTAVRQLFQPFSRAAMGPHREGLGLGLYIASEIAKAHGGSLSVASDDTQTEFTFRMPLG
jgi:signal transduction histidine kinase